MTWTIEVSIIDFILLVIAVSGVIIGFTSIIIEQRKTRKFLNESLLNEELMERESEEEDGTQ